MRNGAGKKPRAEIKYCHCSHIEERGSLKGFRLPGGKLAPMQVAIEQGLVVWDKTADKYELAFGHSILKSYRHKIAIGV